MFKKPIRIILLVIFCVNLPGIFIAQTNNMDIDKKVKAFFKSHKNSWHDLNVPESDGEILYDLIIKNNYTKALEIGTSTGRSGIWIAWALSKTGGKLITIEIDEERHNQALRNFEEAGLSAYIDARLGNAHDLVKELKGRFDFVFSDADKDWYTNYFKDIYPKLETGGCFTAHNISNRGGLNGTAEFFEYVKSLPDMETTLNTSGRGLSISFKKNLEPKKPTD